MSNSKHTLEPWDVYWMTTGYGYGGPRHVYVLGQEERVAKVLSMRRVGQTNPSSRASVDANAERIVACVNALAGLNPEGMRELVEAVREAELQLRPLCGCSRTARGVRDILREGLAKVEEES